MSPVDLARWEPVGTSANCDCYSFRDGNILLMVPHEGTRDTATSARANIAFQDAHWERMGRKGGVIVIMDSILDQDPGARAVYATETSTALTRAYALVGESFWGRAIGAVFTGLRRPPITTRFFASVDEAVAWLREVDRTPERS